MPIICGKYVDPTVEEFFCLKDSCMGHIYNWLTKEGEYIYCPEVCCPNKDP